MNRAKKDAPPRFPEFREAFLELMGDMTLEQFAKKLGMSRATVGFYAAGQRIPDALGLKKIAEKCNVSADWLLGLTNIQTNDTDLRKVCEYTGLSEETISELSLYAKQKNIESSFLSRFFESMVISDDSIETICNFLIKAANANTVDELFRIKKLDELTDDEPAPLAKFTRWIVSNISGRRRMVFPFYRQRYSNGANRNYFGIYGKRIARRFQSRRIYSRRC